MDVVNPSAEEMAEAEPGSGRPDAKPSLLGALVITARHRGIHLSVAQLVHDHLLPPGEPSIPQLIGIAEASGLRARHVRLDWKQLMSLGKALPAIVLLKSGAAMAVLRIEARGKPPCVVLQDPNAHEDALLVLDEGRFTAGATGDVILLKRDYRRNDEELPFGARLIATELLSDKRIISDLAIAAVALSLLAVGPIIFWRLLIDRVLYYHALSTLTVLCAAFAILVVFETAFGHLRRYFVQFVIRRADAKLSTYMFDRVLNLPLDFFERTTVGKIAHVMHEIFKVRNFLTQALFGVLLDALVLIFFLPIMFAFSAVLTAFVLMITGMICLWIIAMLPTLRRKTALVVEAEIAKNTLLIETLAGIRTVKSLALDARRRHEWDVRVARAALRRYDEGLTASLVQTVIHPFERLMVSGVLALAVYLYIVTNEQVYVGALIAFMMLTQRAAAPLIQASTMLQQFDEARIALNYISGLVNQPAEEGRSSHGIRTPLVGRVEFHDVRFCYRGATTPALDGVSFTIPEGSIFGIMGRSGSGKTTVTRLLQMLHANFEGLIKIDGNDLREFDIDHLRASLGVVLQENFLFSGTIRETIAATKPDATFEEIVQAARLAGAEEFIERLPRGYETYIFEGSPNLSGGQRQRLAIARALIGDPRILILDEATSALDAESEAIVNANLLRIAKGRTLIIIPHRLSSLVGADSILVLERGRVYDLGRHDELLDRCDIYSALWHQQHRHLQSSAGHEIIPLRPAS
jgi:ATP-binding cassette, subfamily B, bacterial HlyB/CyaB